MSRSDRHQRRARRPLGRHLPAFDRLEFRLALTGSIAGLSGVGRGDAVSGVVGVLEPGGSGQAVTSPDPGVSGVVAESSGMITFTPSRPIDPFSITGGDFKLVAMSPAGPTSRPISLSESSDPAGDRITLTPDQSLAVGRYRLLLLGINRLQTADGQALSAGGQDVDLADFAVAPRGLGLSGATDLGVPNSTVSAHSDQIDLSDDPSAYRLYKLTLPGGHFWRLGLEVSALSVGGTLASELSLYDAQGALISTASHGLSGVSGDPYLFDGVGPGTYYAAVSGVGVIPRTSGDPAGFRSALASGRVGGPFQLHFVADTADQPTRVLDLGLDRADGETGDPTGLTVQFSGPIRAANLGDPTRPAAVLVDAQGGSWPLTPIAYDLASSRLSFGFSRTLPTGHYSVMIADPGVLTDLAGLTPVAPGRLAGMLGSFDVIQAPLASDDLGTLLPGVTAAGVGTSIPIGPGGAIVEHFTVVEPGEYSFQVTGDSIRAEVLTYRSDPTIASAQTLTAGPDGLFAELSAGSYSLLLSNKGPAASKVGVEILARSLTASLVESGVAQGPALGLRAISPSPDPAPAGHPSTTSGATTPGGPAAPPSGQLAASPAGPGQPGSAPAPAPTSATFFLVGNPVGRPGEQTGPAGPAVGGISSPTPSKSSGLPSGSSSQPGPPSRGPHPGADVRATEIAAAPAPASPIVAASPEDPGLGDDPALTRDRMALADAAWLDRLFPWTFDPSDAAVETPDTTVGAAVAIGRMVEGISPDAESPARLATMASPIGIGVLAAAILRYRLSRRGKARAANARDLGGRKAPLKGPHLPRRRGLARIR